MCKKLIHRVCFILMLALILASASRAADPDLLGWWPLNEGSGDTVFDLSASGNNGTIHDPTGGLGPGGAVWVNDPERGMVVSFNGNNSSGAYISTDLIIPFMDLDNDFTWALWCKQEGDGTGVNETMLGNRYGGTPTPGSGQFIKFTSTRFEYYSGGHNGTIDYDDPPSGQWVHIAVVKDGATLTHYRNGEEADSSTTTATIDPNPFGMGGDSTNGVERWSGHLSDVRLYTRALTPAEILGVMAGSGEPWPYASVPEPADGALYAATWVNLAWRKGAHAITHDVYLADNFDDVDNGAESAFQGNQTDTFIIAGFPGFPVPNGLVPGTTYYWRIDEVNESEPNSPWKGDVWSFSIPPKTAYSPDPIDGAEFVDLDTDLKWTPGYGARIHTVYFGDNYDEVDTAVGGLPTGGAIHNPGTLEPEKIYYWRVDEFDAVETHKGDVWAFTTPGAVGNAQPVNGAADVQINATLSWTAADNAASHELYFGTDADAVRIATTASPEYVGPRALGSESYDPGGLAWDSSYAWRVDEVYPDKTVKGLVWTFATADFLLVDDFESYDDIDPAAGEPGLNRIFDKWIDGFGTTTNGAVVGNALPPYAEQTIVHGGAQSMNYAYDNAGKTSEATLTLVWPRDWTAEGVTKLSLWIRGSSSNAADRIYIALNGSTPVYHDDASATQLSKWNEWVIDLAAFGVNLTNVNTITIGIGTKNVPAVGGGQGMMYFDDIRLIR